MRKYDEAVTKPTQREPLDKRQVENNAGGYVYQTDDMERLRRFLILGSDSPTFYQNERELTRENAQHIVDMIMLGRGLDVLREAVEVSQAGRAPKNDPALFVWALAMHYGSLEVRRAGVEALPKIARIGTHLFHAAHYLRELRRADGRSLGGSTVKAAFAEWYHVRTPEQIARQMVKYAQRDGWSHADIIRLSHPLPANESVSALFQYALGKGLDVDAKTEGAPYIRAHELAKELDPTATTDRRKLIQLIGKWKMPHRAIPTEALRYPEVWDALLPHMGIIAIVRSLVAMQGRGYLKPNSEALARILKRLQNAYEVTESRIHPIQVLAAVLTYRRKAEPPIPQIIGALDWMFHKSFDNVEPTNQRYVVGVDVSGSMTWGNVAGVQGLAPMTGAAAMAMLWVRTEPMCMPMAFSSGFNPLQIAPASTLHEAIEACRGWPHQATDCALPMVWAEREGIEADVFVVITDNETWFGEVHPMYALRHYRQAMGINAKLVVIGMTSTGFSIADPDDAGCLDVVGFDTSVPAVVSDFARNAT